MNEKVGILAFQQHIEMVSNASVSTCLNYKSCGLQYIALNEYYKNVNY